MVIEVINFWNKIQYVNLSTFPLSSHRDESAAGRAQRKAEHPEEGHVNVDPVLGDAKVVLQVFGQEDHVALKTHIID
jgi:hypothetical protein